MAVYETLHERHEIGGHTIFPRFQSLYTPTTPTLPQSKLLIFGNYYKYLPIPVAAPSNAWLCGGSLAGIVGSNPAGGMDVCLL
jgi:hypothetical protein